jgi:hypothetical protein
VLSCKDLPINILAKTGRQRFAFGQPERPLAIVQALCPQKERAGKVLGIPGTSLWNRINGLAFLWFLEMATARAVQSNRAKADKVQPLRR